MNRDPQKFSPVVVLAPARSNGSVVTAMVGAHPELYGFPELGLFGADTLGERLSAPPLHPDPHREPHREPHRVSDREKHGEGSGRWNPSAGLTRALAELIFDGQGDAEGSLARAWLDHRRSWSGAEVLDLLLAAAAPRIGVERSPETVNGTAQLARTLRWFPRARFLHVTRHPLPSIASIRRHDAAIAPPTVCARAWCTRQERVLNFVRHLADGSWMRVRSEDVLRPGSEVLGEIARWLGVDDGEASLDSMRHPESGPYSRPGPGGELASADPGFLLDPVPRPATIPEVLEAPPAWGIDPPDWKRVVRVAGQLGYE